MSDRHYLWKRFWCAREGVINLQDGGYLVDPDGKWASPNPHLQAFEELSRMPCLALLGEPGIGKSTAMQEAKAEAEVSAGLTGDQVLSVDMRTGDTEDRLLQKIFQHPAFRAWSDGTHVLHLYLDSLDECLVRVATVAALLLEELPKHSIDRLFLRVACRTAEWPLMLEDGLVALWGKQGFKAVELAPLRRKDVESAAASRKIDVAAFLGELDRVEVVPLAIKPVTLDFLLDIFAASHGTLPATQTELYALGCRRLCSELNPSRRTSKMTGSLTSDQRFRVAGRIAALMLFSNRYAVSTGTGNIAAPGTLALTEIAGGTEQVGAAHFDVTEGSVQEALSTGLFSARGPELMGWAHQTYAEFLAAWYLKEKGLSATHMLDLVRHANDPEHQLVPQLYETAAWLAGMVPAVFRALTEIDPAVLLRSDVATADPIDREALFSRLLEKTESGAWQPYSRDDRRRFHKMDFPGLSAAVRPAIIDRVRDTDCRLFAIDVAKACKKSDLQDDLADIALNEAEDLNVRVRSAGAVASVGDASARARLRPLAFGSGGTDPEDELKACGLNALWPELISAAELFPLLTQPKAPDFMGSYWYFLEFEALPPLASDDLPLALDWAAHQEGHLLSMRPTKKLENEILLRAWDNLEVTGVPAGLAAVALKRISEHEPLFGRGETNQTDRSPLEDPEKRHIVVEAIVALTADRQDEEATAFYSFPAFVVPDDIPWLIGKLQSASTEQQKCYAKLIGSVFSLSVLEHTDGVMNASESCAPLAEELSWLVEPVVLGSSRATLLRKNLEREQKYARGQEAKPLLDPSPAERIVQHLDLFEAGNPSAWWHLNRDITLSPTSTHFGNELAFDLTQEPGWEAVDEPTRERIVSAAARYVQVQDPETSAWFTTNTGHRPAWAGYRALHLLLSMRPEALHKLPESVWKKWVPMILSYPVANHGDEYEKHCQMVEIASRIAPTDFVETLMQLIDFENAQKQQVFVLDAAKHSWDQPLANAVLDKAISGLLMPHNTALLLGELLKRQEAGLLPARQAAQAYAETLVAALHGGGDTALALAAAGELVAHAPDGGWHAVWPAIQAFPAFGHDLMERVASQDHQSSSVAAHLAEEQIADLFLWLVAEYPYAEDPKISGAHAVGSRESVAHFRDSLPRHLQAKATGKATIAVSRLVTAVPDLPLLRQILAETQETVRRRTWTPLSPRMLMEITSDSTKSLVQNGDQLLSVIQESLARLQSKLKGETPTSQFLWNKLPDKTWRPKDEEALSDYVKTHLVEDLKDRGIIVNREVQIRRGQGTTKGEDTDIHVDAVFLTGTGEIPEKVSVIIEAKGNWHAELFTAMETQLVQRYLKDNECRHGLYLVGWFQSASWDPSDPNLKKVKKLTLEKVRSDLKSQAEALSVDGLAIAATVLDISI